MQRQSVKRLLCDTQSHALHSAGMERHERLQHARVRAGYKSAADAARRLGVPYGTYSGHENGGRGIKEDELRQYALAFHVPVGWLQFGEGSLDNAPARVPLGGYVGAGGRIDTSTEQREAGVEYEAELAVKVPDAVVCYEVVGESMLPVYEPGAAIICRAYTLDPEPYLDKRVVLATKDGARHVKVLVEGTQPGRYNLESLNKAAAPMRNVEIAWVARIAAIIPADEWHILEKNGGSAAYKKDNPKRTNSRSTKNSVLPWERRGD